MKGGVIRKGNTSSLSVKFMKKSVEKGQIPLEACWWILVPRSPIWENNWEKRNLLGGVMGAVMGDTAKKRIEGRGVGGEGIIKMDPDDPRNGKNQKRNCILP